MSKKEIATVPPAGGELAQYRRSFEIEGEDKSDLIVPRIVIHQGKISEKEYGKHPDKSLLNSATRLPLGSPSNSFVAVGANWVEYVRWDEDRGGMPIYRTRVKSEVPPEDLDWTESGRGREPPACEKFWNFIVIMDGVDSPLVLRLKASSKWQRNAYNTLVQTERLRFAKGLPPLLWKLNVVDATNDKGSWYEPQLQPAGEPTAELLASAELFRQSMTGRQVATDDEAATAETERPYDPTQDG